jgi:hypothetical protein
MDAEIYMRLEGATRKLLRAIREGWNTTEKLENFMRASLAAQDIIDELDKRLVMEGE